MAVKMPRANEFVTVERDNGSVYENVTIIKIDRAHFKVMTGKRGRPPVLSVKEVVSIVPFVEKPRPRRRRNDVKK